MDNEKYLKELESIVDHANHGNMWPLAIMGLCVGAVFAMAIIVYNWRNKQVDKNHHTHQKWLRKLSESNEAQGLLLEKFGVKIEHHDESIKEIKRKI